MYSAGDYLRRLFTLVDDIDAALATGKTTEAQAYYHLAHQLRYLEMMPCIFDLTQRKNNVVHESNG